MRQQSFSVRAHRTVAEHYIIHFPCDKSFKETMRQKYGRQERSLLALITRPRATLPTAPLRSCTTKPMVYSSSSKPKYFLTARHELTYSCLLPQEALLKRLSSGVSTGQRKPHVEVVVANRPPRSVNRALLIKCNSRALGGIGTATIAIG